MKTASWPRMVSRVVPSTPEGNRARRAFEGYRMIRKAQARTLFLTLGLILTLVTGLLFLTQSDQVDAADTPAHQQTAERPAGWNDETHGNKVAPNYEVVFPTDKVNQLTITIDPETWEAMQANMTELYGEPGQRRGGPGGGPGFGPPGGQPPSPLAAPGGQPESPLAAPGRFAPPTDGQPESPLAAPGRFAPPAEGQPDSPLAGPGGAFPMQDDPFGGVGGLGFLQGYTREKPMWVTATIEFEGKTWTNVGVRYKGNSSLRGAWSSGSLKLPFKLDFDEFEDEYPKIDNQRFYGFKQLSLANNFSDNAFLRDTITYELLAEAGLVAAESAPYEVFLDYGDGPVNLGLYTMIEVIDDTVVSRHFNDDSGNIYEGDGPAASLAAGTFDQIETSFQKENNTSAADWSEIEALYEVLHSDKRTTDPEAWRAELESIFDVDTFLKWLALGAVIQHWDTYGAMPHNYYLYNDPDTGRLTWISWDHNMVLDGMGGPMGGPPPGADRGSAAGMGRPGGNIGGRMSVSLDRTEVGEDWPLIRFLLDEPLYFDRYVGYLAEISTEVFDPDRLAEQIQAQAELLAPYAGAEIGEPVYENAVHQLIDRVYERAAAVETFLGGR